MQRPEFNSRITPSPTPLPSPPDSATKSPFERSGTLSPLDTRRSSMSSHRKFSRGPYSAPIRANPEESKCFVYEDDASQDKYMHHFDKLTEELDVIGPNSAEHQVKQDPTGTLKTWEYQLPEHLWPPIKENAKCQDAALKIRWSRENGYVQITNIGKALGIHNLKMSDFLRGYDDQIVRIRGGQIEVQGSWIPYDTAYRVCLGKCYKIRHYLAPLFGPSFVSDCLPSESEEREQIKRRPGRRPRSPTLPVKRLAEDDLDDESDLTRNNPPPKKRPAFESCASGKTLPPRLPSDPNMDDCGLLRLDEICPLLTAARELQRLHRCAPEGTPYNDWPAPGDSKLGCTFRYNGHRYMWDGAEGVFEKTGVSKTPLPPLKEIVQPPSTPSYIRFPMTPSPHQSPYAPASYDWQGPFPGPASRTLISPPMSCRESFSGSGRERQYSVATTDECRTPVDQVYTGSLFPTPQPEGRYD